MPTTRAKLAIKNIGKTRTEEEALVNAHYSPSYARSGQIKKTKGWQELMDKYLPDELIAKRHQELINKRDVKVVKTQDGQEVAEVLDQPETQAVSKGIDMAYKLKGSYAPEQVRKVVLTINAEVKQKADKAIDELIG